MKSTETIEKIASKGDTLATLKALRQKLASTIDVCNSARDIASLSRQLTQVIARIAELEDYHGSDEIEKILSQEGGLRVRSNRKPLYADIDEDEDMEDAF